MILKLLSNRIKAVHKKSKGKFKIENNSVNPILSKYKNKVIFEYKEDLKSFVITSVNWSGNTVIKTLIPKGFEKELVDFINKKNSKI